MIDKIKAKLKNLPTKPGVYLFKDESSQVIYVGKAINLRNRVSQYFRKDGDGRAQIPALVSAATDLDYIVTDTDVECLLLENTLIKKYLPRYNIKLRDDKNYTFIKIDYNEEIPQIYPTRNTSDKNAKYFGPYSSAFRVRETLHILRKIFPYCANKKIGTRPCFYYYLHRCPGICIGKIALDEYQNILHKISLFLLGNISATKKEIKVQMKQAAVSKMYERAADLRDQLHAIEIIEERQKAVFANNSNWDFISYFCTADKTTINLFLIREGKLVDRKNFILEDTLNNNGCEIINAFMNKYYVDTSDIPKEIYVQDMPTDTKILENYLKKVRICKPTRGKKSDMIKLGVENAKEYFESWAMSQASELSRTTLALEELGKVLNLEKLPFRMECFDISNTQGTNAVASMVVFENGKPKKSDYRKFKMKIDGSPNDFEMMREALTRRFSPKHEGQKDWPLPDLLVIDGGKGQLGVAVEVLNSYNLNIPTIGLAKREEEIFKPDAAEPVTLPHSNYALQLLQRLRDEAHRFAITFHKQLRSKGAYKSALDDIRGIGPKKKKALLKKYGSVSEIKKASPEELASLVGQNLAEEILSQI